MNEGLLVAIVVLGGLNAVLLIWLALRRPAATAEETVQRQQLDLLVQQQGQATVQRLERMEGELRREMGDGARAGRQEMQQTLATFQEALTRQGAEATRTQNAQLDGFAQQLLQLRGTLGDTLTQQLQAISLGMTQQAQEATRTQNAQIDAFAQQLVQLRGSLGDTLVRQLQELSEANARRLTEVRSTLETQLAQLQASNATKLDEMRSTVDEKLQSTLEARLGQSFKLVSERLEAVQRGLGEMQTLAAGVGDLKRVLTNVKDRGGWGEIQLENLLEQILTAEQFARGVKVRPGSNETVDFAIRLPGQQDGGTPVWLPIDAKFPREDYERLLDAQERGDTDAMRTTALQLERAIKIQGKSINEKYVAPPYTTDFAVLFLATEGLYAEAIRRPGLVDALQQHHRIVIAGPTTLAALLNSLQMGFRTLAIEKRSSEVWQLLGAVKSEFGKFATVLESADKQLNTVQNSLKQAGVRTRQIERKLKGVESLPGSDSQPLLGIDDDVDTDES